MVHFTKSNNTLETPRNRTTKHLRHLGPPFCDGNSRVSQAGEHDGGAGVVVGGVPPHPRVGGVGGVREEAAVGGGGQGQGAGVEAGLLAVDQPVVGGGHALRLGGEVDVAVGGVQQVELVEPDGKRGGGGRGGGIGGFF